MQRSSLRWVIVLAIVLAGLWSAPLSPSATATGHDNLAGYPAVAKHFFPAVPNNAMIGDTGPWHATIVLQNMERSAVKVFIMPDGRFDPDRALESFTMLTSFDSRTLTADELGIKAGSVSSLVVMAINQEVWESRDHPEALSTLQAMGMLNQPSIAATLKQSSPGPMDEAVWTDASHQIVDGYTAIPMNDAGWGDLALNCPVDDLNSCADIRGFDTETVDGLSYLPLAQTNSNWNTTLYISNVEGALQDESVVEVQLIPTDRSDSDDVWSGARWLKPGGVWEIDVLAEVGPDWTGSVRISSSAGTAAVAARYKAETDMMLMNASAPSRADDGGSRRLSAPLVYVGFRGWNTGISLSNQTDKWNSITISLYDEDGNLLESINRILLADGQANIYLPSEVDAEDSGWVGSAVFESEEGLPFHVAVDQVNYENGSAMSYTVGARGAAVDSRSDVLGLPLMQKGRPGVQVGDTSGIQMFNADPVHSVRADVQLLTATASRTLQIELGPLASYNLFMPDGPETLLGAIVSVRIHVTGGGGEIVALSNMTNYDVQGDGALVFSLSNGFGQFR